MKNAQWRVLAGMLYPQLCFLCKSWLVPGEEVVCVACFAALPRTNFTLQSDNPVEKIFHARIPLAFGSSFLHFSGNGAAKKIMHGLKYKGQKEIGSWAGKAFGAELLHSPYLLKADCLMPIPLHKHKQKKRGFNQSEYFASGIGAITGIPMLANALARGTFTTTQTRLSRFARWKNVDGRFEVLNPDLITGKRIVLVDDVVTTGATLESCAQAMLLHKPEWIGVLTLAVASH